jgi:DNA topoisomerase-2
MSKQVKTQKNVVNKPHISPKNKGLSPKLKNNKKEENVTDTQGLTVEEEFQSKKIHEHVLLVPGMYVGGMAPDQTNMDIYDKETKRIVNKLIEYIPGLYKIFDEAIVNARDHSVKDPTMKELRVIINQEEGSISVYNDGNKGMPVKEHAEWGCYVPEGLFTNFMTSGNFHRTNKTIGAKNGYGIKLTSVMSSRSDIEVVDATNKKKFTMTTSNNMYDISEPVIEDLKGKIHSYVKFKFIPDYKRFGVNGLSDDMMGLFVKRVYDIAAVTKINVYLNDEKILIKGFDEYIKMFYDDNSYPFIYDDSNDRWKIGVVFDPDAGYRQISYVNGICTFQGGTHVQHVVDGVVSKLNTLISEKNKGTKIKSSIIKDNITFFIDAVIDDPDFPSQTKEYLGSKLSTFGSRCTISDDFIKLLAKTGIVNEVVRMSKAKEQSELKSNNGKKKANLTGYTKLNDAKNAGTRYSKDCTLILTEGDSAKPFGVAGAEVLGVENVGVFPLKGKLLNVREATIKQLKENEEIKAIIAIMGLKYDMQYEDVSSLRYGNILVLTDQDLDGYHIKGLVMNFIEYHWPSLANIDGFITSMNTPLKKVWKLTDTKKKDPVIFYSEQEYDTWKELPTTNIKLYTKAKYYKGLGTSTEKEAKEAFKNYQSKRTCYGDKKIESDSHILRKMFSRDKDGIAFKKDLLMSYDRDLTISPDEQHISYTDFVHKELAHFANYAMERAIPSGRDGFKPSIKKILYTAFKEGLLNKEVRVSELAGFVIGAADYHHGEASLQQAIVGMAQNFVGANNINWLLPIGQFGNRSGNDASSPRYINTQLNPLAPLVFRKEDSYILEYAKDDNGKSIEPVSYAPIICNVLVNGTRGIGVGFSSTVPSYNPTDIISNLRLLINDKQTFEMDPWYKGFKGRVVKNVDKHGQVSYEVFGIYEIIDENKVVIEELPVGVWTDNYKEFLGKITCDDADKLQPKHLLKSWDSVCGNNSVNFTLIFHDGKLQELVKNNSIETKLELVEKIHITNMHLYDSQQKLKKYDSVDEILKDFYNYRLDMYIKRKEYYTKVLENKLNLIKWRIKFLEYYADGKIIMMNGRESLPKGEVIQQLIDYKFPKLSSNFEDPDKTYSYLTDIKLFDLTKEEKLKLQEQLKEKENEYNIYINTPVKDIWLSELDEFEKRYNIWLEDEEDNDDDNSTVKGKGKGKGKGKKNAKPLKKKLVK